MATLLSTDKLDVAGPSRSNSFKVEQFNTDNYRIRAAKGFNNAEVKYGLTWVCLTQAEAEALQTQFDGTSGVDLIQWTPPLEDEELNFTVESYNVTLDSSLGGTYLYNVTATLRREYDLV